MPGKSHRKSIRRLLTLFKWCRVAVLLLVFTLLAAFAYLHTAGLPDFVKKRLLSELRTRGVNMDVRFSTMKLGWANEVIIRDIGIGAVNDPLSPSVEGEFGASARGFRGVAPAPAHQDPLPAHC